MAKSTQARFGSDIVGIARALEMRGGTKNSPSSLKFTCLECGRPVRPHKEGGGAAAHFEHLARNPQCGLSHVFKG